jgi:anaerobic magnesium-protoporphyrin IX monomethyl ester cyclase
MKKPVVVFIVMREYDNLGIGYMAAILIEAGFETEIIDVSNKKEEILEKLKNLNPLIVGFSVIYQYHISQFTKLIRFLRQSGIKCHFTAGGHYATLKYDELLKLAPSLDSVVRFEGEYTIRELTRCISNGNNWKNVESLAYVYEGKIIANPLRPLEKDLDQFPFPKRTVLPEYAFGKKFATLLGGRGCVHSCSFCNLKEFYRPFPGFIKRIRKPEMVVNEMEYLFREKGCSVFLFQDDDFPVKSNNGSGWIDKFCSELKSRGLSDKIMWKINCRPDEVEEKSFAMMKNNGLFLVFIGIEDGTDSGLKELNKHMTAARCQKGIDTLKKLEIGFDFGFMLFQPNTNFRSLDENLNFLRELCGDGFSPVSYLKMMPYYATRIEKELLAESRIKGAPGFRDYDFIDDSMNHYFDFITCCFLEWFRNTDGVANISKWARNYVSVCSYYFELSPALLIMSRELNKIISESNLYFLDSMKELAKIFESGKYKNENFKELKSYKRNIKLKHENIKKRINRNMSNLLVLVELQRHL